MDEVQNSGNVSGAQSLGEGAPLGARLLAALFDLVLIPIVLGVIFGLLFFAAEPTFRNIVLFIVNFCWTAFRDVMGGQGPGKRLAGVRLVDASGANPALPKHLIRNALLWIPFVLIIGYLVEFFLVFILKKDRLGDKWVGTKVVKA